VDLQGTLSVVCERLARLGDGVYVLAPPGSGRRGLARCLAGRGFKVFVPRGYGVEAAEEYRDVEDLTRRLEEAGVLVFVVVGSSWEAVKLAAALSGRLKLVYLPALYGELLVEGRRRGLAWVSHDRLCAAYEGRVVGGACEGPAPGLLSLSPAELEASVEALEALRRTRKSLGEAALRLLLDVADIIGPFGGVAAAVKAVYDFFQAVTRQRHGEVAGLLKFVEAAEKAREYVRRPEFEALVDSVALEWEMETGRFKILVEALGDPSLVDWLAHGRHVESLSKFGRVYARYNAEELGVTEEYMIEAGVRYPLAKKVFVEKAKEVMRLMGSNKAVVLKGPRGVGKSTLAKYVAYTMLMQEQVDYVIVAEGLVNVNELLATAASLQRRVLLLFDVHPREVYMPRFLPGAVEGAERPLEAAARAINSLLAASELDSVGRLRVLLTASDDELKALGVELDTAAVYSVDLGDVEFLAEVVKSYMGERAESCQEVEKLARIIKEHHPDGAYTLIAKYAGLWLRGNGCNVESVERAVEEAKKEPKLFLARYIRDVLLWRSSEEERVRLMYRVAAPLLLHAYFGPVPEGVTYITQAKDGVVFYQPEEIEKFTKPEWDLLKAGLQPIAKWLAQRHEDLVKEVLRDLAGLNGEEARKPYREALRDLIKALDWARGEALKEGGKILAEVGIPKEEWILRTALWAFVNQRLAAVFKSGESRRCWQRAVFIAGHALAGYPVLSRREQLPEDIAEALGDALKPCAVDDYLTTYGEIPWLSIDVVGFLYYIEVPYARDLSQIRKIRERLDVLTPFADVEIIKAAKKTAEELLVRWGKRDFWWLPEISYALGLAALAAEAEVDGEMADLLLYAAPAVVQRVAVPVAVLPVLEALRPLGGKAPHRYVVALAAASELETLDHETVKYIYDALQQLKTHLLETERNWPLVNAIATYSNLLRKHSAHIKDRWEETVANMCELYSKVRGRSVAATPESNLSAHRLFDAVARAHVLAVALVSGDLAQHVQRYCGLGDLIKEAEAVRSVLDTVAAHLDELRKIMESNADFAEWVTIHSPTGDAGLVIENVRAWFTSVLAGYKLNHAIDEKGELDEKKLEEAAEEFEKAAEIHRKLKHLENYLIVRGRALRTRVLAVKSWEELLERAKGFWELWREAEKHLELTAINLATAAVTLGEYLVYLAASGDKRGAEELLKKWRWLLDYYQEVSVATRLMLKLLGVGEGAKLEEVVDVFEPWLSLDHLPALWLLAGHLQKDEALEICRRLPKSEACVDAVMSVAGDQEAAEKSKLETKSETPPARPLRDETVERTLVEVRATTSSLVRLAFMLLAAVEGRTKAVRIHSLLGSLAYLGTIGQLLFNAVYENCGDLNSEGCRMALLKLYYYHI
jgi:energy-coupling factor transporter ATP-binding protein EcfA2